MISASYPYLPLWLATLLFFLLMLAAREIGSWMRRRSRGLALRAGEAGTGESSGSAPDDAFAMTSVLGLLALLIGFTFSIALQRYDARRELVVKEANALGTTWLRTDLLAPEDRARMQDVLRRYVDARIAFGGAANAAQERAQYRKTAALQDELWRVVIQSVAPFHDTPRASLLISTTNESIDVAGERLATRQAHIPARILRTLFLFALLAAGFVGYERARQRKETTLLLLLFALAVGLVMDLDEPSTGVTNVPQQPMLDLRESMTISPVTAAPASGAGHAFAGGHAF